MPDASGTPVTIVDVARRAGVSHSTVSRVLNGRPHIKPETRRRVEAALSELGYVANLSARSLAGGRLGLVGLVVLDLEGSYSHQVVRGVDQALAEVGLELMLCTTHRREQREHDYVARLSVGMCDGLIVLVPKSEQRYAKELAERRYPFVLVDHKGSAEASGVIARNEAGAIDAMTHLAELGHQRIGHITGSLETSAGADRLAGYRRAVADLGLDDDPSLVYEGDFSMESGEAGARHLMRLGQRPTAIFVGADAAAIGAAGELWRAGLSIPSDISLVGFDDLPEAEYAQPPLTTVRQPMADMGREAVKLLLARIDDPTLAVTHLELPTTLIVRSSTAPPRG
ncbi:MAG: LacI family DNA-binding transcriptional regulator [Actinomycetota bacterium]